MKILIKNCIVLPLSSERSFKGAIGIEGNRIAMVTEDPLEASEFGLHSDVIIDGENRIAMPGLINTHTHAAMTLMRGMSDDMDLMDWLVNKIWPIEAKLDSEDIYWGAMLAAEEMICSGTTTYVDMYWDVDANARVVEKSGLRSYFSITVTDGTIDAVEKTIDQKVQQYQHAFNDRFSLMIAPHAPYTCSEETVRKCVRIAKKHHLILHTHLSETAVEVETIRSKYGVTPTSYYQQLGVFDVPVIAAHCVHLTEDDFSILKKYKVAVAHNPHSNMKLASGVAPITEMLNRGITVSLGTDGASSNNNLDLFEELRTASLLQKLATMDPKALKAYDALKMMTVGGAKAIGREGELGEITVGALADIILLDCRMPHLNPLHNVFASLVYAGKGSDVTDVIVDGQILMRERKLLTIDGDEVLKKVENRVKRLK